MSVSSANESEFLSLEETFLILNIDILGYNLNQSTISTIAEEVDKALFDLTQPNFKKDSDFLQDIPPLFMEEAFQLKNIFDTIQENIEQDIETNVFIDLEQPEIDLSANLEKELLIKRKEKELESINNVMLKEIKLIDSEKSRLNQQLQAQVGILTSNLVEETAHPKKKKKSEQKSQLVLVKHPQKGELVPVDFDRYVDSLIEQEKRNHDQVEQVQKVMQENVKNLYDDLRYRSAKLSHEYDKIKKVFKNKSLLPTMYERKMLELLNKENL